MTNVQTEMENVETAGVSIHPARFLANVMKDLEKIRGTYVEVRVFFFSVSFFFLQIVGRTP